MRVTLPNQSAKRKLSVGTRGLFPSPDPSKTGRPWITKETIPKHYSVKEAAFPFVKFPGIDIILGPEMKATGEVMGIDAELGMAYAKAQMAAFSALPTGGKIFVSVRDRHKEAVVDIGRGFHELGFEICSTGGTAKILAEADIPVEKVYKLQEGRRPNVLDMIKNGEIALIVNTPSEAASRQDETMIRSTAVANKIPIYTNLSAARACVTAIRSLQSQELTVKALQDYHPR